MRKSSFATMAYGLLVHCSELLQCGDDERAAGSGAASAPQRARA